MEMAHYRICILWHFPQNVPHHNRAARPLHREKGVRALQACRVLLACITHVLVLVLRMGVKDDSSDHMTLFYCSDCVFFTVELFLQVSHPGGRYFAPLYLHTNQHALQHMTQSSSLNHVCSLPSSIRGKKYTLVKKQELVIYCLFVVAFGWFMVCFSHSVGNEPNVNPVMSLWGIFSRTAIDFNTKTIWRRYGNCQILMSTPSKKRAKASF